MNQRRNAAVRTDAGDEYRQRHQGRRNPGVFYITDLIEQASRRSGIVREYERKHKDTHHDAADDAKEKAVGHKLRSFVIILRELGKQGRGRHLIDTDGYAGQAGHDQQVSEQEKMRLKGGRHP